MDRSDSLLNRLADPLGGVVLRGALYRFAEDEPDLCVQALSFAAPLPDPEVSDGTVARGASGSGRTPIESSLPALGEMLERLAACSIEEDRIFKATAADLGSFALDLRSLPACSAAEFARPSCYAVPPLLDKQIRWVEGVSLSTGLRRALPFSLVYLHAGSLLPHERLQAPISTGLAAHENLEEALVAAILEVIERDALSIHWLQRIPGHPLSSKDRSLPMWAQRASTRPQYRFFDISTDLGVPVVLCVRVDPASERAHTLLACAAGFDRAALVRKTVRDISAHSIGFRGDRPVPASFEDFTAMHHGATYMAHRDRATAFAFLSLRDDPEALAPGSGLPVQMDLEPQLAFLLQRLRAADMEAFAVDLTSVEAASAGVSVVRVLVPGLQPLPYRYSTRYLAHPRLYSAPVRMGRTALPENEINPWPLPFA